MQLTDSLHAKFDTVINPMGYAVVRVQINGMVRKTLQIMIEKLDEQPINVEDCAIVSRTLSVHLNVEDPISGHYVLEISSPGLERPLIQPKDYKRFQGQEIVVKTILPVGNRKIFQGTLETATDDGVSLALKNQLEGGGGDRIEIRYGDIRQGHLVSKI
jgi:ribosome maturation factor RimP